MSLYEKMKEAIKEGNENSMLLESSNSYLKAIATIVLETNKAKLQKVI
jgi:hypothetical protein